MKSQHAPFIIVIIYVCSSMLLYWAGPINWPMTNAFELAFYQIMILIAIFIGYLSVQSSKAFFRPVSLRPFFKLGVFSTLIMQIPLTLTYTGKFPWDIIQTIFDQRVAYEEMLEQVMSEQGTRFYVPLLRSAIMPFYYAAIVHGTLNFSTLTRLNKLLLVLAFLCPIDLSLLRGTDKEIFDIVIISLGLIAVGVARSTHSGKLVIKISQKKKIMLGFIIFSLCATVFFLFTYRKFQRLDSAAEFCIGETLICADYSGIFISILPDFMKFGLSMLTAYLTNGYYGLSLALEQTWNFSYGIGHSYAFLSFFERFTDASLLDETLIGKISALGWDHRYFWATIFTWIANDVGFLGALVVIGLIARLFRQSWNEAVQHKNDSAAIVFILLCLLFFYLPANNQLTQTFDSYFAFLFALFVWKMQGKFRRLR